MFCNKCGNEVQDSNHCPHCNQTPGQSQPTGNLPTSGLAIASMILGICSFFLWIFTAIPGLIMGIIGLNLINRGERKGRGIAVTGIVISGLGTVIPFFMIILAGMLLPALGSAREKARRISCTSNLKQIGLSLKQYAMDYNDCFPNKKGYAGFKQLIDNDYLTDKYVYTCPSCPTVDGTDYIYLGGFMEGSSDQYGTMDTPLAFDIPKNHKRYINILFQDGHVQGFSYSQGFSTVKDVIDFLNRNNNYSPAHLKVLYEKAAQADREQMSSRLKQ